MSLITCPECSGIVSDKAYSCPHCGFPMQGGDSMPIKRKSPRKRRPNGSGTIVRLKGNRKNPYQVRVRTRLDDRGYPTYDVLGNYPDQISADLALAEYNRDPYDPAKDLCGSIPRMVQVEIRQRLRRQKQDQYAAVQYCSL